MPVFPRDGLIAAAVVAGARLPALLLALLPAIVHAEVQLDSFYTPPASLTASCLHDGDVLKDEATSFVLPTNLLFSARRIMYCSRDTNGVRMAVTGTVITPKQAWLGQGPRPIIGFAAGTQGVGNQCAPSYQLAKGTEYEAPQIAPLLAAGYGVSVTDYQGLGTPGIHTYVNRKAQGQAVLDSIRAAQRLATAFLPAGGPVAIWGYSQGGGAAAAAAELQQRYAPELDVKGVYAGAVPADLQRVGTFLESQQTSALLLYAVHGLHAGYPDAGFLDIFNATGRRAMDQVINECTATTAALHPFLRTSLLTNDGKTITSHLADPALARAVKQQLMGLTAPTVPVYVVHSRLDDTVEYTQGRDSAIRWCNRGATVQFDTLLVPGHVPSAIAAGPLALAYMAKRFAGVPAPGNCGKF